MEPGSQLRSPDDIARRAASESSALTPSQQARLRRLRIKRTHQRLLSHAQWSLWLRRRRRLWHRRRPLARRRHLARQLALEYGRPIGLCGCCRRRRHAAQHSAPARKVVTQWLPSHSRLVKRFHYRIVSLAVQPSVACATLSKAAATLSSPHDSAAAFSSTAPCETRRARRLRLRASCAARVAIPCEPARKDQRFLQRWTTALAAQSCRLLCGCNRRNDQPEKACVPSSAPAAAATMLADLSHHCVYALAPRGKWPFSGAECCVSDWLKDTAAATWSALTILIEVLRLRPDAEDVSAALSGVVFALSPTARHHRTRQAPATAVHGHMWSAGAACLSDAVLRAGDVSGGSVSTLSRHTRVVPVVLVASLRPNTSVTALDVLLFSEGPVHFTRRAMAQFNIQLVSLWNPCARSLVHASVFEYWRCELSAPSSISEPEALSTFKRIFQRCARVYRRLQLRPPHPRRDLRVRKGKLCKPPPRRNAPSSGAGAAEARTAAHGCPHRALLPGHQSQRLSLVAFPSLSSPFIRDQRGSEPADERSAPYAWRLALLVRSPASGRRTSRTRIRGVAAESAPASAGAKGAAVTLSVRHVCLKSRQARRAHFQLTRRFFGLLLMAPPTAEATCSGAAARGRCRALGFEDRATLLHLVGRPAYPMDYGLSRPSAAAQQRQRQRSRPTPIKARVTRQSRKRSRTPTDRTSAVAAPTTAPLPSYSRIMEYYGNVSNAVCRVFVRAAHTDRKLPALHSSTGTILLQCRWRQQREDSASLAPCVERVGVVSSSAFFAQRFGCMVAPVWCCFPEAAWKTGGGAMLAALTNEDEGAPLVSPPRDRWTAAALAGDAAASFRALGYLLAPPEVADDLLRRSALFQRDDLPRPRTRSRHQRALDLRLGRAARALETLLYDPLICSPVQLIEWYA
ncbi:hypothetical protein LSCM1_02533 [Leishmania martiniquensis]|uniref:Uncharacterized protein n=1 Tax=Leishmania martiniquensis TaxID=1580590 RepID=A0A836H3I3_9TRYP|nr:hypothetical protein LSCM1_02533 [Leishmania martiniquensis]